MIRRKIKNIEKQNTYLTHNEYFLPRKTKSSR